MCIETSSLMASLQVHFYEKRACNLNSDCTVGKILIFAKNSNKCIGGAKWKLFSSPVIATLVLVGALGECF